ncbi:thioesterase II family protein [Streptomyces sp. NPDC058374]|uniref:thioesterase II family protein n=1 Tax=Streptomyces sp. NPDC058374 TaxID=3346466 RepID=UPI00364CEC19
MLWTRTTAPRACAPVRLFCFPHAGGSPLFFRGWAAALDGAELYTVCYPGRAERLGEPPAQDLRAMARLIGEEIAGQDDGREVVLFGHSMGALVAYETAAVLEERGAPVSGLVASGARAPHLPRVHAPENPEGALRDLTELGGTEPELLAEPGFRELILPALIADFAMLNGYTQPDRPPLSCPVTALVGDADPRVTLEHAAAWRETTRGTFRTRTASGGHFHLAAEPPFDILRAVCRR